VGIPRRVGLDTFLAVEVEILVSEDENETATGFFRLPTMLLSSLNFPGPGYTPSTLASEPDSCSERSPFSIELVRSSVGLSTAQLSGGTHVGLPGPLSEDDEAKGALLTGGMAVFGETLRLSPDWRMPFRLSDKDVLENGSLN